MQQSAGRVRHHDGRERPKFESTFKNICEMRAEESWGGGFFEQVFI